MTLPSQVFPRLPIFRVRLHCVISVGILAYAQPCMDSEEKPYAYPLYEVPHKGRYKGQVRREMNIEGQVDVLRELRIKGCNDRLRHSDRR